VDVVNRRNFLRLGALFVPAAIVEPRRVYSFIWARPEQYVWEPVLDDRRRDHDGDFLIDAEGNLRNVQVDIGKLIAESLARSVRDGFLARDWAERVVIEGTISI